MALGPVRRGTLKEQLLDSLRRAIASGAFPPGQRLVEGDLATQLGVSRAPIREAIGHLLQEGLVEVRGGRGIFVRSLTARDAREIYTLRAALETLAATMLAEAA